MNEKLPEIIVETVPVATSDSGMFAAMCSVLPKSIPSSSIEKKSVPFDCANHEPALRAENPPAVLPPPDFFVKFCVAEPVNDHGAFSIVMPFPVAVPTNDMFVASVH